MHGRASHEKHEKVVLWRAAVELCTDAGNADKLAAADVPVLAARGTPLDLRSDMNGESLLSRNHDFNFAGSQVRVVQ